MNKNTPHLLHVFPSFGRGGIPIQISHAINYFGDKAPHTIISTNDDYGAKEVLNPNVNVDFPDLEHLSEGGLYNRLKNYQNYLENEKPDAVLSYNWGSIEWVLANSFSPKIYNVHSEHGFGPDEDAFIMAMEKITSSKETQLEIGYQNLLHVKHKYDRLIMYKKYAALWRID